MIKYVIVEFTGDNYRRVRAIRNTLEEILDAKEELDAAKAQTHFEIEEVEDSR